MKKLPLGPLAALACLVLAHPAQAQNGRPDAEGYLRDWLVLAPFRIEDDAGTAELDRLQFPSEALPEARAGATQTIGDRSLTWRVVAAPAFYLDFKVLHPSRSDYVIAWAVAYVTAPRELTGLTLRMNSNDQGKAYLNGREVVKFADTRTLDPAAEDAATGITLKKGVNLVVLKVINGENDWQGSLRFLDAAGKPVTDLKIATAP